MPWIARGRKKRRKVVYNIASCTSSYYRYYDACAAKRAIKEIAPNLMYRTFGAMLLSFAEKFFPFKRERSISWNYMLLFEVLSVMSTFQCALNFGERNFIGCAQNQI